MVGTAIFPLHPVCSACASDTGTTTATSWKREQHLSNNEKWRSFPRVPHLLQYVSSGNYFGKVKINGRFIRQSLHTSVWTTAQLRLNDLLKEHQENRSKVAAPKFKEAAEIFKWDLDFLDSFALIGNQKD